MKNYFFDEKSQISIKIFGIFQNLKIFKNVKNFDRNLRFFIEKNNFSWKFYFLHFTYKICSILTKYEGNNSKNSKS